MEKYTTFNFNNRDLPVHYIRTDIIKDGVECDIYSFVGDHSKDLAIVRVQTGSNTPLQKVVRGTETLEGYLGGQGSLNIISDTGKLSTHDFQNGVIKAPISIKIDETMQWRASNSEELIFYEICIPTYKEGRFEEV